jgi:hypothetical protein
MYGYFHCHHTGGLGFGYGYGRGWYSGYVGRHYSSRHWGCPL